jgi:hypothetical protein
MGRRGFLFVAQAAYDSPVDVAPASSHCHATKKGAAQRFPAL